ncbi:hypothetical protein POVWA1_046390 [Plasmodium ovale wallikeri]|nr:hypothetical protein POVWA1_046390 [Plasmodium ovale wallikeri]
MGKEGRREKKKDREGRVTDGRRKEWKDGEGRDEERKRRFYILRNVEKATFANMFKRDIRATRVGLICFYFYCTRTL